MSAPVVLGELKRNPKLILRQAKGTLRVGKEGVAVATEEFVGYYDNLILLAPRIDAPHPRFPSLLVYDRNFSERAMGLGTMKIEYRGQDPGDDKLPDPVYDLDRATAEQPIDTHPDFEAIVAAAGGAGLGKAVFDDDGLFLGFGKDSTGDLAGLESYLAPTAVWTKTYVSKTKPASVGNVGKIDSPDGSPPVLEGGANWLNIGLHFTKEGGIYRVQVRWLASGPGGWILPVYS